MTFSFEHTHSLADAPADTSLAIARIPLAALRTLCADLGLAEGDRVTCESGSARHVLVKTAYGRRVRLDRGYAMLIETEHRA